MPDKNDLSAYKLAKATTLPRTEQAPMHGSEALESSNRVSSSTSGRKPKPLAEKQSEIVSLRLTPSEMEVLRKKAGLVPVATYVKHTLFEQTDLLK